jgi:hypothetical protein
MAEQGQVYTNAYLRCEAALTLLLHVASILVITTLVAIQPAAGQSTKPGPSVYFDQSHEYLFIGDGFAQMLQGFGFGVVNSRDTFPPKDLSRYPLLILQQERTSIDYDAACLAAIERHLDRGGGLLIFADYANRDASAPDPPLNRVLARLGVRVSRKSVHSPLTVVADPAWGGAFQVDMGLRSSSVVESAGSNASEFHPLVTDQNGNCIVGAMQVGAGRVVVSGEQMLRERTPAAAHNQFPEILFDPVNPRVRQMWHRIATWLAGFNPDTPPAGSPLPAIETRSASSSLSDGKVTVYYSGPMRAQAEFILSSFQRIYAEIKEFYRCEPAEPIYFEALPGDGGGFTSGRHIGIGALADQRGIRDVMLWEMTNAWGLPQTPSFVEAWTTFTHYALCGPLGIRPASDYAKRVAEDTAEVDADDPDRQKIDITLVELEMVVPGRPRDNSRWDHIRTMKCGLMVNELYRKYGIEFLRRVIRIHHALHGDNALVRSWGEFVNEWSLAAGRNLADYFRSWGARFEPSDLPDTPAAIKIEADRLIALDDKRHADELAAATEYEIYRAQLQDESWVDSCTVTNNLAGNNVHSAWIPDIKNPPQRWSFLAYAPGSDRHGFLVLHPLTPTTPCKLVRKISVPGAGRYRLAVGGMLRAGGNPVEVRLFVDGAEIWSQQLTRPMKPFHHSEDLAGYAGKTVTVRFEVDSKGQWGFREVLLNYLTLVAQAGVSTPVGIPTPVQNHGEVRQTLGPGDPRAPSLRVGLQPLHQPGAITHHMLQRVA